MRQLGVTSTMMLTYIVCLLVLCGSRAEKEVLEDFASLLSDSGLSQEIKKRLSDLSDYPYSDSKDENNLQPDKLMSDPGSRCNYKVEEGKIIRTHDSINNGASYIDSPVDIQNISQCRSECCKHDQCDLAVFKDKGDEHACYLFACGDSCLFTNHTGFSTMRKYRKAVQHEMDLENLATDPPTTTTTTAPTTTSTTTTTTTTTPAPSQKKEPASLFSACSEDEDCAGKSTECVSGFCVCSQGYHAQEGFCREECSRFQFECANVGKPLDYPQCIAVYDTCDGITHCQDGSDELKCDSKQDENLDELAKLLEEVLHGHDKVTGGNSKSPSPGVSNTGNGQGRPLPRPEGNKPSPDNMLPPVGGDIQHPADRPRPRPHNNVGANTQHRPAPVRSTQLPAQPLPPQVTTKAPSQQPTTKAAAAVAAVTATQEAGTTSLPPSKRKPAISGGVVAGHVADNLLNDAEAERPSKASNRMAVVVLAMGLAVTALLLIFVGCRLRMVKRRLRRGRPLNSNEADYLINGMYL